MTIAYKRMLFFARIALIILLISSLSLFLSYKRTIENKKSIEYSLVNQTHTYWRGTNYKIDVIYNVRRHQVSISRRMSDSINLGKMSNLYYHEFTSSVISEHHQSMALKVISVLGILFFLSFLLKARL